jgi:membrane-bound lytic murein transglycosylase D
MNKLFAMLGLSLATGAALCLAGCEDSSRNAASYHPPTIQARTVGQQTSQTKPSTHTSALPRTEAAAVTSLPAEMPPQTATLAPIPRDAASELAKKVTAVFASGEEEEKAGYNEVALGDYNRALDLLLASGIDLPSNPELSQLFNAIMSALPRVDGSSQEAEATEPPDVTTDEQSQPSPLDEINAITAATGEAPATPADTGLRTSAEKELQGLTHDIPITLNDPVLSFVNFFQTPRGRAIVENGLSRAGRYRPMIERVLAQEGMPSDLIYLAQAESAFEPQALSRAGARGLWQFMAYRGKQYGLEHTWWVDERQDPEKATRAAAQHLRDLYDMFGDWYLVMAAYNSGPGTVQHAIERTGYADFWQLYKLNVLPQETRNYVPIILALTLIAKDPARYGIDVTPDDPVQVERVQPGHPLDLRLVAETLDVDVDTLRSLNPELLRLVTPNDPRFVLQIPAGKAEEFEKGMAEISPEHWLNWRRHRLEEGETLATIARKYRVTLASLAEANGLDEHARPDADSNLIIPTAAQAGPSLGAVVRYRARRGDTMESVADEFNVTPAEIRRWNGMRTNHVVAGMRLKIYPGVTGPAPAKASVTVARAERPEMKAGQPLTHRVREGETLWSIAQAYQTTIDALRSGNRFLFSRPLQAGDILTIVQQAH